MKIEIEKLDKYDWMLMREDNELTFSIGEKGMPFRTTIYAKTPAGMASKIKKLLTQSK